MEIFTYLICSIIVIIFFVASPCELHYGRANVSFYFENRFSCYKFIKRFVDFLKSHSDSWIGILYDLLKIPICIIPLALHGFYNLTKENALSYIAIYLMLFILAFAFNRILLPLLWTGVLLVVLPSVHVYALIYYGVYFVFWAKPTFEVLINLGAFLIVSQATKDGIKINANIEEDLQE